MILNKINSLLEEKDFVIVAIDGDCAAGKSTLAASLKKHFDCNVIHMDDFFLRTEQRTKERLCEVGGNVDYERFCDEVLVPLLENKAFSYRPFDCKRQDFGSEIEIIPNKLTIVEGSYCLHSKFIFAYDFKVFMSVSYDEQLCRIEKRNGKDKLERFKTEWIPKEKLYHENFQIKDKCDLIINEGFLR